MLSKSLHLPEVSYSYCDPIAFGSLVLDLEWLGVFLYKICYVQAQKNKLFFLFYCLSEQAEVQECFNAS